MPLYRDDSRARTSLLAATDLLRQSSDAAVTILDKTVDLKSRQWIAPELLADARLSIVVSERSSNFFVDSASVTVGPGQFVVILHDDDDFGGLASLASEASDSQHCVLMPTLGKALSGTVTPEVLSSYLGDTSVEARVEAFLRAGRPQAFLFSAVPPDLWAGWRAFLSGRPMPSLSLDFTLSLYLLAAGTLQQSRGYVYTFNMHNWSDSASASRSTDHWLQRDGWTSFGNRDVWFIRLCDDLSLLSHLSDSLPPQQTLELSRLVIRYQDGLAGGRLRLDSLSPSVPARVRWPLHEFQEALAAKSVTRLWSRGSGSLRPGRSVPYYDARPERALDSLVDVVLPSLRARTEGSERSQIDYWIESLVRLTKALPGR